MTKIQLLDKIRAYKMGEINWSDCKAAVDAHSSASNGSKPIVSGLLPPADDLMQLIEKQCAEHITISGLRFYGTSWAQLVAIFEKFGYERKIPF